MTDIDPAAIVREHASDDAAMTYSECVECLHEWPCLPYRLAEALAAAQEDVARLSAYSAAAFNQRDAAQDALAASEARVKRVGMLAGSWRMGLRDRIDADDISAALADQSEQAS